MILNDSPKNTRFLFLDMNSFFARVEQQVQPVYRGHPVGVTPYTGDSGCVIAASYEAKALGVRGGCRVGEAKKICPKIIILPARPQLYHLYHKEIIKTAQKFSPFIKVMSIDEFSIRLTGRDQNHEEAIKMAFGLKSSILKEVGDWLTCSIGLGPNQFLAKIAGELKKPDGLFEITLENLQSIYQKMALTDLTGINFRMEKQFNSVDIYTPTDLYNRDLQNLSRHFGIMGKAWYYRLRGYELDESISVTKTIGHSHVLPPELRNHSGARKVIIKLVEKTGYRLRRDNFWADHISLGIGYYDQGQTQYWHKMKKISFCQDNQRLIACAMELFSKSPSLKPISIHFSTYGLIRGYVKSISLFPEDQRTEHLSTAMDKINDKYGASTIQNASLSGSDYIAPDRIPFGRPRFDIRNF